MKVFKGLALTVGTLFILVIGFFAVIMIESNRFKDENELFVSRFIQEFSKNWDIQDIQNQVTDEFITQVNSSQGHSSLQFLTHLGELVDIRDFTIETYHYSNSYKSGEFHFKARFRNAETWVRINLLETNRSTKVNSLDIIPIENSTSREILV